MIDINTVSIEGKTLTLYHQKQPFNGSFCIDSFDTTPKLYLRHREEETEWLALGEILILKSLPRIKTLAVLQGELIDPKLFGALSFDKSSAFFFLPKYLLEKSSHKTTLHQYSLTHSFDALETKEVEKEELFSILSRQDLPDQNAWQESVIYALGAIDQNEISKVVLARQTELELAGRVSPSALLNYLNLKQQNSSLFSFEVEKGKTFLGSTPECLFSRQGREITTEALAGTCKINGPGLLKSKKELYEFNIVKNEIARVLYKLCSKLKQKPTHMVSTGSVQHIHSGCFGTLKSKVDDHELAFSLHPTPAICGLPQEKSLHYIERLEPFKRRWYSSPLGYVSESCTRLVVAIRSATLEKNQMTLYAGCGLIEGSDPDKEWEELESKIAPYLNFFDAYAKV